MTNLDSVLKRKDIPLTTKVHIIKAMNFPVVMYRCESWTIKKAAHWGTDAFKLWFWRRLLGLTWPANQSILKEIISEYSLEGLILQLKLQYFGHVFQRADSLEKVLMLGKSEARRRRGWQKMRWFDGITNSMDMSLSQLQKMRRSLACFNPWGGEDLDMTGQLNNSKDLKRHITKDLKMEKLACEKMLHIICHQGNANYNEIPVYIYQNGQIPHHWQDLMLVKQEEI